MQRGSTKTVAELQEMAVALFTSPFHHEAAFSVDEDLDTLAAWCGALVSLVECASDPATHDPYSDADESDDDENTTGATTADHLLELCAQMMGWVSDLLEQRLGWDTTVWSSRSDLGPVLSAACVTGIVHCMKALSAIFPVLCRTMSLPAVDEDWASEVDEEVTEWCIATSSIISSTSFASFLIHDTFFFLRLKQDQHHMAPATPLPCVCLPHRRQSWHHHLARLGSRSRTPCIGHGHRNYIDEHQVIRPLYCPTRWRYHEHARCP